MARIGKIEREKKLMMVHFCEKCGRKWDLRKYKPKTEGVCDNCGGKISLPSKSRIRHRNRCQRCGRTRGYLRDFGMCRICVRELSLSGELVGVRKSSW